MWSFSNFSIASISDIALIRLSLFSTAVSFCFPRRNERRQGGSWSRFLRCLKSLLTCLLLFLEESEWGTTQNVLRTGFCCCHINYSASFPGMIDTGRIFREALSSAETDIDWWAPISHPPKCTHSEEGGGEVGYLGGERHCWCARRKANKASATETSWRLANLHKIALI